MNSSQPTDPIRATIYVKTQRSLGTVTYTSTLGHIWECEIVPVYLII
jgi:hypothetical protein